ncbi:MAG: hypothetical protein MJ068_03610 [Clostridia bacterium]|nr:hypothetical protein [Clostridia bacterium]
MSTGVLAIIIVLSLVSATAFLEFAAAAKKFVDDSKKKQPAAPSEKVQEEISDDVKKYRTIAEGPAEKAQEEEKAEETAPKAAEPVVAAEPEETEEEIPEEEEESSEPEAEEVAEEASEEEAPQEEIPAEEPAEEPMAEEVKEESADEDEDEEAEDDSEEDEEQEETVIAEDGTVIKIRYNKSFIARLTLAPDNIKKYYNELKKVVLSYKKVSSRISWSFDSINFGRTKIAAFNVRGKSLYLYLALDAADYEGTKFSCVNVETKKYAAVPCLYKIRTDRKEQWAEELIADLMKKFGIEEGKECEEDFTPEDATFKELLEKGLIKVVNGPSDFAGIAVAEEEKPAPAPQEETPEEDTDEADDTDDNDEDETEEETIVAEDGTVIKIRYNKSFTAKLTLAPDNIKKYYNDIKNAFLSYKKVTARLSWPCDTINKGRDKLAVLSVRGKSLYLYMALDPAEYEGTKYTCITAKAKKYASTSCLYKIKTDRKEQWALELVEDLMTKKGIEKGSDSNENFIPESATFAELLEKGLIKE